GAIERIRHAHVAALNRGDAEAWADLFAEDGVQMPPHAHANVGRQTIRAWGQELLQPFHARFALDVSEIRVSGEAAFERGRYTMSLAPKADGAAIDDVGKYITVYQRQPDQSWKVARDIWNSDNPLPAG